MGEAAAIEFGPVVHLRPAPAEARALVVCEHASNRMPPGYGGLGLSPSALDSHIAWDPGALGTAAALAGHLGAPLVSGGLSRLLYDLNRPPEAPDAIPGRSEVFEIPGNAALPPGERQFRIDSIYRPFHDRLTAELAARKDALRLLVTVHSFTPTWFGAPREVEIGLLHGTDDRFVTAMNAARPADWPYDTRINAPYGPEDGVTHMLERHGPPNGLLSVMLEIRNDLVATPTAQAAMAARLAPWIAGTLEDVGAA